MPYTFDTALDDPDITIIDRNDTMGSYAVKIGTLSPIVFIELGRFPDSEMTKFIVSYSIHTPMQAGPYHTSKNFDDYPAYALHRAISNLTSYYRMAVDAGHKPHDSWMVKN